MIFRYFIHIIKVDRRSFPRTRHIKPCRVVSGLAPCISILETLWWFVVRSTLELLYHSGKKCLYTLMC